MAALDNGPASEEEEDEQLPPSREATPSPTPGTAIGPLIGPLIGPIALPRTGFEFIQHPVGNSTLWGNSIAPKGEDDGDKIEPLGGGGVSLEELQQTDEGIGAEQDLQVEQDMYDGLFVPSESAVEEKVEEVRVVEGEGLQGSE